MLPRIFLIVQRIKVQFSIVKHFALIIVEKSDFIDCRYELVVFLRPPNDREIYLSIIVDFNRRNISIATLRLHLELVSK